MKSNVRLEDRITYLRHAIKVLRSVHFTDEREVNRIVSICDYCEELEALELIISNDKGMMG